MIQDFIFDGRALSDFGYMAVFENSEDVIDVSAMQFNTIKAALSDINHRVSHSYEQNYTSTFFIMKSLCDTPEEEQWMTHDDITEMTRWLARKQYKWFRFIDDDDDDEIWYKVQIQVAKEYVGANVAGLQLTVTANAPYGFTREIKKEIDSSPYPISVFSDEEGYIYPNMTIEISGTGDFVLINEYENRTTRINNCVDGEIITIWGEDNQQISSSVNHDFTKDFNYVFPRLCNQYGDNKNIITTSLNGDEYSSTVTNVTSITDDIGFSPSEIHFTLNFTATPTSSSQSGYMETGIITIRYDSEEPEDYSFTARVSFWQDGRVTRTQTFHDTLPLGDTMDLALGVFDLNGNVYSLTPAEGSDMEVTFSGDVTASGGGGESNITLSYRGIRKVGFER